jgi:hypothetical protein
MTFDDLQEALAALSDSLDLERLENHTLDRRVGPLWTDPERTMIASINRRTLDYYGGFEYIDPEYIVEVGEWTCYSREHGRVDEALGEDEQ